MFRYIRSSKVPDHILPITVCFDAEGTDIAASDDLVSHPKNIKRKYRFSEDQLAAFNDIISTVCSVLKSHHFKVTKTYQSKKSYSYYIHFYPTDKNGDMWDESIVIVFSIREHSNKSISDGIIDSHEAYVKTFLVGSKKYEHGIDVMKAVRSICDRLSEGDYSALDEY